MGIMDEITGKGVCFGFPKLPDSTISYAINRRSVMLTAYLQQASTMNLCPYLQLYSVYTYIFMIHAGAQRQSPISFT